MSTKVSLYFKEFIKENMNYVSIHIFEETMTSPPYRIDFELECNGMYLRGALDKDCIEELKKEGLICPSTEVPKQQK